MADAPACALCSKPILYLAAASIDGGELVHLRCQSRANRLKHLDTADSSLAARSRMQAAVERARDLTEATRSPRRQKLIIIDGDRAEAYDAGQQRHGRRVPIIRDRRITERRQAQ